MPTAFNFLGPLTNPARPSALAVGVADPRMGAGARRSARGARQLGAGVPRRDGLDELTTTGPSTVWVVADGTVAVTETDPLSLGIARATLADLRGGDAAHNAGVVRAVLSGERGPVRDIVLLNAAAAIAVSEGLAWPMTPGRLPPGRLLPRGSFPRGSFPRGGWPCHGGGADQGARGRDRPGRRRH